MGSWEALSPSSKVPSCRTWSPKTLNSSWHDSSDHLEEQWSQPFLKAEDSMAKALRKGSKGWLKLSSSPSGRDLIVHEVTVNKRNIEDICLCCGSFQVYTKHPLFEGGMCIPCKDRFLETVFLYDDDGYQRFCTICCSGNTLLICESLDCTRCYCFECVDTLVRPGTTDRIHAMKLWVCFLCLPFSDNGLLRRRKKWHSQLKDFHDREAASSPKIYKTVSAFKRKPLRVLSLFGNIKKELTSLGFLEGGSGSEGGELRHVDDVTDVLRRDVEKWGPFDLLYGCTQPKGYSCNQKPGWYMYHYHRILEFAKPLPSSQRPFFWMFVDNMLLEDQDDLSATTRFLEMKPVTLQDVSGTVLRNAVKVWGNIPALKRHKALTPEEEQSLRARVEAKAKLAVQGPAQLVKNCFLPLREYFKYFPQN